mmetsp:Transcript_11028/g.47658  ORF Transcript_11028/g.47658 Transcript_11028/m.47658 type:complete len:119 (+) Transcript_11028:1030-1386(+)
MSPTKTVCAAARGATAYLARDLALAWRLAATAFLRTRTEEVTLASVETFAPMAAAANIWEGARGVVGVGSSRPMGTRGSHALPTGVRWPRFHEIAVKRVHRGTVTDRDDVHLYNWIIF